MCVETINLDRPSVLRQPAREPSYSRECKGALRVGDTVHGIFDRTVKNLSKFLTKFLAPGGGPGPPRAPKMGPGVVYKKSINILGISIWNSLSSVGANCKSHFCFSYFINVPIFLDRFS